MCCNNTCGSVCSCNCGCGCNCGCTCGDSGVTTLPAFPDTPAYPGTGSVNGWPVYVSVPSFLWSGSGDSGSDTGCGCCT